MQKRNYLSLIEVELFALFQVVYASIVSLFWFVWFVENLFFFSFHVVLGFCKSEVVDESEHFRSIMLTAVSVSVWWWPVSSFYLLRTME